LNGNDEMELILFIDWVLLAVGFGFLLL
jgi:hypothetical protein